MWAPTVRGPKQKLLSDACGAQPGAEVAAALAIAMSGSVQNDIDADGIIGKDNQAVAGFLQDTGV